MLIADLLYNISSYVPVKNPTMPGMRQKVNFARQILDGYELFSTERSALMVASELRTDNPPHYESIISTIFSEPKKLFIECSYHERKLAFHKTQSHQRESAIPLVEIGDPVRIASIIDSNGDGTGTINVLWTSPKSAVKAHLPRELVRELKLSNADYKHLENMMCLNLGIFQFSIDLSQAVSTTLEEFRVMADEGHPDALACLANVRDMKARNVHVKDEMRTAWTVYRTNKLFKVDVSPTGRLSIADIISDDMSDAEIDGTIQTFREDLNGEDRFGIALAAILQVQDVSITYRKPTPASARPVAGRKGKMVAATEPPKAPQKLGVVSMHLGRETEDLMYQARAAGFSDGSSNGRRTPTLHFVRGHLFKARNGKFVYRRPHTRGSLAGLPTITRVKG